MMKHSWPYKKSGLGLLVIILTGCEASNEPTIDPAVPAMEVTSLELGKAFDDNEAAAQLKYGSSPLLVSGTVKAITLDFSNEPVIEMAGVNQFSDVQLSLAEEAHAKAAELKKGQKITLRCGSISEVVGTPMLSGCIFPEKTGDISKDKAP